MSGQKVAAYDLLVKEAVILYTDAMPSAPALMLRPWRMEDVPALVVVCQDPALRRWTSSGVESDADAMRWVETQQRGWAAGDRFAFAVLESRPGSPHGQLVGNVVVKEVAPGKASAEVGYWTAAHARGRGVAPRALEALTGWAFDALGPGGLQRMELLHQVDNAASCRVAEKSQYEFSSVRPADPPTFPLDGHLHTRRRDA